jgi:DNA modification methylase
MKYTTMKYTIEEQLNLGRYVTPKPLETKPIHRWYIFPHSFTSDLVHQLVDLWGLDATNEILDPFVGAGTTLLAAKEKGIPATGYDLSPLAVLATRVKIENYDASRVKAAWGQLRDRLEPARWNGASMTYPQLVVEALPGKLLGAFDAVAQAIGKLPYGPAERDFLRLALLSTIPKYSRAEATGGWLKWIDRRTRVTSLPRTLEGQVEMMLRDLESVRRPRRGRWRADLADARKLPDKSQKYGAVITSPPYPNRHDYTRVFGIELMFGFLNWSETRQLRYQSMHSHPEGRPKRPDSSGYRPPTGLVRTVKQIKQRAENPRITRMLEGYFLDMYLSLLEVKRVCLPKAKIALVVGNAQYCGEAIRVDELTAEIGEKVGLRCDEIVVTRYRSNSAQQMREYGRNPSRESVVMFTNVPGQLER